MRPEFRPDHHPHPISAAEAKLRSLRRPQAPGCKRTLPASTQCEAGSMTALSRAPNVREHGFQMDHYPLQVGGDTYELAV